MAFNPLSSLYKHCTMVKTFTETFFTEEEEKETLNISKTRRKKEMHALQALGESLIGIGEKRLQQLNLPDKLYAAIKEAEKIKARGAKARQIQYIGRLMRDIDPEPIQQQISLWAQGKSSHDAQIHEAEQWREAILSDTQKIEAFSERYPQTNTRKWKSLAEKARYEKNHALPPKAYRELFRLIKKVLIEAQNVETEEAQDD